MAKQRGGNRIIAGRAGRYSPPLAGIEARKPHRQRRWSNADRARTKPHATSMRAFHSVLKETALLGHPRLKGLG